MPSAPAESPADVAVLDAALARLGGAGFEYGDGFTNHGPMAVEALAALGRPDAIPAFVASYGRALETGPPPGTPVGDDWRAALGAPDRAPDWTARFERELDQAPWRAVLERWAPRLAPGMIGAATHGWLRAAHAARAIALHETEIRRTELARGLAYWAATYTPLPGVRPGAATGARAPRPVDAARRLPEVPRSPGERLLTDGIARLQASAAFAAAVPEVDLDGEPLAVVSELTAAACSLFLASVHRGGLFALAHAVTSASALRLVLPHVTPETGDTLVWHAWQALSALQSGFGAPDDGRPPTPYAGEVGALVDRAIVCGDEHGVKFTEACLRELAVRHDPVYLAAAAELVAAFEGMGKRPG